MDKQLLFEIGAEEIPAVYLLPAVEALAANLGQGLRGLGLSFQGIGAAVTPRRLVVRVDGLIPRQLDRVEEVMGPAKKAAFTADGQPTKAALGFVSSRNASLSDLKTVQTPKGEYLMLRQERPGQDTRELLPELLAEMIRQVPFPKSMRWGSAKTTFARPIQWLVALYDGQTVPLTVEGAGAAGEVTYGHRFMAPQAIKVRDYDQYVAALREAGVLVEPEERQARVRAEIDRAAAAVGGTILPDPELVDTVANLVESPHALAGSFDPKFLALPQDALITSMREHQKYFAVLDERGRLKANFVAVNNTKVKDAALGAAGHQRVLRARLEDGLFFFREDQKQPLAQRVAGLEGLVFQNRLGTMREKTERVRALARALAARLAPERVELVDRAAYLAKADLLTAMVNEFPSLQGAMGRDYARLNGEDEQVAIAIHEHYLPVRAEGQLPEGVIGAIVGIADRIDTIAGCFGIGQAPTGSTDPFGLRRQALGLIRIVERHGFSLSLTALIAQALTLYADKLSEGREAALAPILEFIRGRYSNDQTARGVEPEAVEAAVSVAFDDLADCGRRIKALTEISRQPAFPLLAGAFKRVMNIIKGRRETGAVNPGLFADPAETALHQALTETRTQAQPAIDQGDYLAALTAILRLKGPVDVFFEQVMVMADDPAVRENRLRLLAAIAALFLQIGDLSKFSR